MLEAVSLSVKFPREGSPASKLEVRPSDGFAGDEPFRPPLPLPSAPMFLGEKKSGSVEPNSRRKRCISLSEKGLPHGL